MNMVGAIAEDRPHMASGELGFHVLDVLLSAAESASVSERERSRAQWSSSRCFPPASNPFA
ncbi:hypothetical protein FVP60_11700 [Microbacterium mitrae]|uniref:Uncharacterized protein n=1 Tax=Microbacterium mitrae TaxID=664640 RepID=A0A5C8HNI8_9MICO|nr:hypothetical protein FVP60_11700 [Microbacterium mitrae]